MSSKKGGSPASGCKVFSINLAALAKLVQRFQQRLPHRTQWTCGLEIIYSVSPLYQKFQSFFLVYANSTTVEQKPNIFCDLRHLLGFSPLFFCFPNRVPDVEALLLSPPMFSLFLTRVPDIPLPWRVLALSPDLIGSFLFPLPDLPLEKLSLAP